MKHEWRKHEKHFYLPKQKPEIIDVPAFKFFTIEGAGNPNDDLFGEFIGVLYSLSYAVKMSPKKGLAPEGYFDYTVYPLEGIWDVNGKVKNSGSSSWTKDDLVFKLMIRQPDFVDEEFALKILEITKTKKPHKLLEKVRFGEIKDGRGVQMMHLGNYDSEPESFKIMETFARANGLIRKGKNHREIYLNDARKTSPDKLKAVLRFWVG